jgi:hypothetical protein
MGCTVRYLTAYAMGCTSRSGCSFPEIGRAQRPEGDRSAKGRGHTHEFGYRRTNLARVADE